MSLISSRGWNCSKLLSSQTYKTNFRLHVHALPRYHSSRAFERLTDSQRRGQDLSQRYRRLERSLRGKEALSTEHGELQRSTLSGPNVSVSPSSGRPSNVFRGLIIPEKPREPESDECCMSGCAICVYDLYEESLAAYRDSIAKVTATLVSMGVPEAEWPPGLRVKSAQTGRKKDVTLSAFEEMERALQRKRMELADATDDSHCVGPTLRHGKPHSGRSRMAAWSLGDVYEGVRWVFFSNR